MIESSILAPVASRAEPDLGQIPVEWTWTAGDYPRGKCIPQVFEEQAALRPDAIAVQFGESSLTFRELNVCANRLAHWLRRIGVGPDILVGICVERSLETFIGLVGVLKAGGAYVPLDPGLPTDRLAYFLKDTRPRVVLVQDHLLARMREVMASLTKPAGPDAELPQIVILPPARPASGIGILELRTAREPKTDFGSEFSPASAGDAVPGDAENPPAQNRPEDLACVMYTSGTTGRPKGVMIPHRGVIRLVVNPNYVTLTSDEVLLQVAPLSFDASTFEIWGSLLNGARLCVFPPRPLDLEELGCFIQEQGVTTALLTTELFHQMMEVAPAALAAVRQLLVGGDALAPAKARRYLELPGHGRLINAYGPTENTVVTCCAELRDSEEVDVSRPVPIGKPISGTEVYILNSAGHPVPVGVSGELFAGGDGLARGYLHLPELTAEKFVSNPFSRDGGSRLYRTGDLARWREDGTIEFLGRADRQVKIRGHRVELEEIEATLGAHLDLAACAVVVTPAHNEPNIAATGKRLVAYWVGRGEAQPTADSLRTWLAARLPAYMIPSQFVQLAALPLNANGKVDRLALAKAHGEWQPAQLHANRGHEPGTVPPHPVPTSLARVETTLSLPRPRDGEAPSGGAVHGEGMPMAREVTPPRNELERRLCEIWQAALRQEVIGVHDKFLDIGGHSLLAAAVVGRIRQELDVVLPFRSLFECPTIALLSERIDAQRASTRREPPLGRADRSQPIPMSSGQRRLWLLQQTLPDPATYNEPVAFRVTGAVASKRIRRALQMLVERHEILRTALFQDDSGLWQRIEPAPSLLVDWQEFDLSSDPGRLDEVLLMEARRPFELADPPLWRVCWIELGSTEHVLALVFHHSIVDEWSLRVLCREMEQVYSCNERTTPGQRFQYADYAVAQQQSCGEGSQRLATDRSYWRSRLENLPPSLVFPMAKRPSGAALRHPNGKLDQLPGKCNRDDPSNWIPLPAPWRVSPGGAQGEGARRAGEGPAGFPPTIIGQGALHSFIVAAPLAAQLRTLGRGEGVSLFAVMMTAFQVFLYRYTEQRDFVVATPFADRQRPEFHNVPGFFLNTLPIRLSLLEDWDFLRALAWIRDRLLEAFAHADLPFDQIVDLVGPHRDTGRHPLHQVMFVLVEEGLSDMGLGAARARPMRGVTTGTSKCDLTLSIVADGDDWHAQFEYPVDLFAPETIVRMAGHFCELLRSAVDHPQELVRRLNLVPASERQQLLVEWNRTESEYPRTKTLARLFEEQVARAPEATALVLAGQRISYGELNQRANRVAYELRARGVERGTRVGLVLGRSVEFVIAVMAVLKAGGTYLPIADEWPPARQRLVIDQAAPRLVIASRERWNAVLEGIDARILDPQPSLQTDQGPIRSQGGKDSEVPPCAASGTPVRENRAAGFLSEACRPRTPSAAEQSEHQCDARLASGFVSWEDLERSSAQSLAENPPNGGESTDVAYVMFTSGSTGEPKGVVVPHRAIVRLVFGNDYLPFDGHQTFLLLAPTAFDASTLELWAPLLHGSKLVIYPEVPFEISRLRQAIYDHDVTCLWLTSTLFNLVIDQVPDALRPIRHLVVGGETLSIRHVRRALENLSGTRLINGYGPTEGTTFTTTFAIEEGQEMRSVPIGRPLGNTRVYVLDSFGQPAGIGLTGELFIAGDGLACGYLNRPDLTDQCFRVDPFASRGESKMYRTGDFVRWLETGMLEFVGRRDRQIKVRGHRVELGEVEIVLNQHPEVVHCVVQVRCDLGSEFCLVAYVVPSTASVTPAALQQFLVARLPVAAVPGVFVFLERLPVSENGKVDLGRLPAPSDKRASASLSDTPQVAGTTELERQLIRIWQSVLSLEYVGIHDDFFALGGHSLLAAQLFERIAHEIGVRLPLAVLFRAPTISGVARVIQDGGAEASWRSLVAIRSTGEKAPLFVLHGMGGNIIEFHDLIRHLGPDQPIYGLQSIGLDGQARPLSSIQQMASHYMGEIRESGIRGPYHLAGHSMGGLIAFELAKQLTEQGAPVGAVLMLDSIPARPLSLLPGVDRLGYAFRLTAARWGLRLRNLTRKNSIRRKVRKVVRRVRKSPDRSELSRQNLAAHRRYFPNPYSGKVVLLKAQQHPQAFKDIYVSVWSRLALGGLDYYEVPGDHVSLLNEPNVGILSQRVAECLAASVATVGS